MMAVEQPGLFDDPDTPDIDLRDRVNIARKQRGILLKGFHPVSGYPLADQAAPLEDRTAPGLRCRTCFFAARVTSADVFKCTLDSGRYVDHSPESDLRLWFPACDQYAVDTPLTDGARG